MDSKVAGEKQMLHLSELDEFCNEAYKNARIYKEKTKSCHDKHIIRKEFEAGHRVNGSSYSIPDSNFFQGN